VSNVLNGTIIRIDLNLQGATPTVTDTVLIATGYAHRLDPNAIVAGPAGLVFTPNDLLWVASTADNEIFVVPFAGLLQAASFGKGFVVFKDQTHLHGPLGLTLTPNGFFLAANSDAQNVDPNQPSELVEFTMGGVFLGQVSLGAPPGGAFGLTATSSSGHSRIAAVDDDNNQLDIWTI
jgi:hypothetical protein